MQITNWFRFKSTGKYHWYRLYKWRPFSGKVTLEMIILTVRVPTRDLGIKKNNNNNHVTSSDVLFFHLACWLAAHETTAVTSLSRFINKAQLFWIMPLCNICFRYRSFMCTTVTSDELYIKKKEEVYTV